MPSPQSFGKYQLQERLAAGAMADIWRATVVTAEGQHLPVVIKAIRQELAAQADFLARFVEEARIGSLLEHPNIARVYEWGRQQERPFIAMEYIEGTNLAALLQAVAEQQLRFPPTLGILVATEVLAGLAYAHGLKDAYGNPLGLVHRDATPPNIVLSSSGQVKLVDFGLARVSARLAETVPGLLAGKLAYLAPEVLAHGQVDARADIFSVGMVLYEVLTGIKLPEGSGAAGHPAIEQVRSQPPSSVHGDIPQELDELILRSVAEQPDGRPLAAASMRQQLLDFLGRWDRRADADALSAFLVDVLSGRAGQKREKVGFAFGEATSAWMAQGENPEELVRIPLAGDDAPAAAPAGDSLLEQAPQAPAFPEPGPVTKPIDRPARAPGKFSGGETVMAIKESGLGGKRTLRNLLILLLVLAGLAGGAYLLIGSMQEQGNKLAAAKKTVQPAARLGATLQLHLQPADAAVLVDGQPVKPQGQPPAIEGLAAGKHQLRILAPGYQPWQGEVDLSGQAPVVLERRLEPRRGTLQVKTSPRRARVWLDGKRVGQTPLRLRRVDASRPHRLVIKRRRYQQLSLEIAPGDWPEEIDQPLVITKKLRRAGRRRRR